MYTRGLHADVYTRMYTRGCIHADSMHKQAIINVCVCVYVGVSAPHCGTASLCVASESWHGMGFWDLQRGPLLLALAHGLSAYVLLCALYSV